MKTIIVADQKSLAIFPQTKSNFLLNTYQMFAKFNSQQDIYLEIPSKIEAQVRELIDTPNIIVEPEQKGTAAAVGLATIHLYQNDPQELIVVAYADHPVKFQDKLAETIPVAQKFATRLDKLILLGVNPTFAATTYGYAKIGKAIEEIGGVIAFEMVDFKEKPEQKLAQKFVQSWSYLWNTGYMIVSAQKLLQIYRCTMPELFEGLMMIKESLGSKLNDQISSTVFASLNKTSLDKGLYEKVDKDQIAILAADLNIHDF